MRTVLARGNCTHILARNGLDDIFWWGPQKFGYDGELVDVFELSGIRQR